MRDFNVMFDTTDPAGNLVRVQCVASWTPVSSYDGDGGYFGLPEFFALRRHVNADLDREVYVTLDGVDLTPTDDENRPSRVIERANPQS